HVRSRGGNPPGAGREQPLPFRDGSPLRVPARPRSPGRIRLRAPSASTHVSPSTADLVRALRADLLLQLVLATVLGGMIGLERELKAKPAGLRTNILICIGAATFTHLSVSLGTGDPGRVAAQVLIGVACLLV